LIWSNGLELLYLNRGVLSVEKYEVVATICEYGVVGPDVATGSNKNFAGF